MALNGLQKVAIGSLTAIFLGSSTFGYIGISDKVKDPTNRVVGALAIGAATTGATVVGGGIGAFLIGDMGMLIGGGFGMAGAFDSSVNFVAEHMESGAKEAPAATQPALQP